MYVVRYRTHGPWNVEHIAREEDEQDFQWRHRAVKYAEELAKSFGEVRLDQHEHVYGWKNNRLVTDESDGPQE